MGGIEVETVTLAEADPEVNPTSDATRATARKPVMVRTWFKTAPW
jgi:hypothetical protein